jgi:hypothetical protein
MEYVNIRENYEKFKSSSFIDLVNILVFWCQGAQNNIFRRHQ